MNNSLLAHSANKQNSQMLPHSELTSSQERLPGYHGNHCGQFEVALIELIAHSVWADEDSCGQALSVALHPVDTGGGKFISGHIPQLIFPLVDMLTVCMITRKHDHGKY